MDVTRFNDYEPKYNRELMCGDKVRVTEKEFGKMLTWHEHLCCKCNTIKLAKLQAEFLIVEERKSTTDDFERVEESGSKCEVTGVEVVVDGKKMGAAPVTESYFSKFVGLAYPITLES